MIRYACINAARASLAAIVLITSQPAVAERPTRVTQSRQALLAEVKAQQGHHRFNEQRLLVTFKAGTSEADKERVARMLGGSHRRLHRGTGNKGRDLHLVGLKRSDTVASAMEKIMSDPAVAEVSPDWILELQDGEPNDPDYATEWALQGPNTVAPNLYGIGIAELWARGITCTSSHPTVVAVIDTGIRMSHEDLRDQIFTNPGEIAGDGIDNDGNGFIDDIHGWNFVEETANPEDFHSHGTHVSGTIAATKNNGRGVVGVCGDGGAKILPLRVCTGGSCTMADVIQAVDYITDLKLKRGVNVRVANVSLGHFKKEVVTTGIESFQAASDAGILFTVAAGNQNVNLDKDYFIWPAKLDVDGIISVGNYTINAALSGTSNYGLSVDIAGPGADIYSTVIGSDQAYNKKSGTSMAAPHVAGALAQYFAMHHTATARQAKAALLNSAKREPWLVGKITGARRLDLSSWDGPANDMVVKTKCGGMQNLTRRGGFAISVNVSSAPDQALAHAAVTMTVFRPTGALFQSVTGVTNAYGSLTWAITNTRESLEKDFLLRVQTADGVGKTFTNAELGCYFPQ